MFSWMNALLLVGLGGLHLELLHDRGPDHAQQDRAQHQQREPDHGQLPRAAPDVEEEQHRADHRDAEQDVLGRQHRVVGGVVHAGEEPVVLVDQVEAVEVVVDALGQHEEAEQHRELGLRRAGEPVVGGLEADAAEEVVHDRRRDQRDDGHRHHEVDEVVQPRQLEDVEADVLVEVGIGAVEGLGVAPQQEVAPLPHARGAGEGADHRRHTDDQPGADRGDRLAVAVQVGLLRRGRPEQRPVAVGQQDAGADRQRHHDREDQEEQDPGPDQGAEDLPVADLAEPQPVGVDRRERGQAEERDDQDHRGDHQCPRPAGRPRGRWLLALFLVEQLAHWSSSLNSSVSPTVRVSPSSRSS